MKIQQAHISSILSHFKKDFLSYYGLKEYSDPDKPALFFGLYLPADKNLFLNHKGFKIVHFGSMRDYDQDFSKLSDATIISDAQVSVNPACANFSNVKVISIAIKDYSGYNLTPLGDKVYIYKGVNGDKSKYYNNDLEDRLRDNGFQTISASNVSIKHLKEHIYPQTFAYVKSMITGGNTTKRELGLMGRPTYHNELPLMDVDPQEVRKQTLRALEMTDKWLYLDFWQ